MSDGEELLLRYHARYTGSTARSFADARDESGLSSYQRLINDVKAVDAKHILDLGCGDGYLLEQLWSPERVLTGLDMSAAELAAARRRLEGRATLVEARAISPPFPDSSFDAVVSHLALMLMEHLDVVLAQVARVLKPNGWCFAIVGVRDDSPSPAVVQTFREALSRAMEHEPHRFPIIGDPRAIDAQGFAQLFTESGFADFRADRLVMRQRGSPREVAQQYGLFYYPASLGETAHNGFVDTLAAAFKRLERQGEDVAMTATVHHLRARRSIGAELR